MKKHSEMKKIDHEFSQMMQKASLTYQEECLKDNEIDRDFISNQIKYKKRQHMKRILTSAAAVVLVLVTGITVNVWCQADGVYGGKRFVDKCVTLISPLNYDEEVNEDGQVTTVVSINKEEHLDAAEEFFDALKIAKYIPKGYSFEQLTIWEYTEPAVEYIYTDGENPLVIAFYYSDGNEDEDIVITGELYRSVASGKKMYINENTATNEYTVIEITKNYECIVMGNGELEEGIRVMESIGDY